MKQETQQLSRELRSNLKWCLIALLVSVALSGASSALAEDAMPGLYVETFLVTVRK